MTEPYKPRVLILGAYSIPLTSRRAFRQLQHYSECGLDLLWWIFNDLGGLVAVGQALVNYLIPEQGPPLVSVSLLQQNPILSHSNSSPIKFLRVSDKYLVSPATT